MGYRIDYPGSLGYEKTYDCIVDTVAELTTAPELVALAPYSMALVLNTDQGNDADATIHVKLSTGSWKQI
ncbi:MAG: hypothetical protein II499_02725 [Firmicutes bacterium]|nr:hypothetical protein [Bacillota bacterium]